jgi:DNA mismatch repair protein MutS2
MKNELINFVIENNLSPFSSAKTSLRVSGESIFKTKDAKAIHTKVLSKLSSEFVFSETGNLWNVFGFSGDIVEIRKRQEFFKGLNISNSEVFSRLEKPRANWSSRYDIVAVTEDESTFVSLNKLGCAVQLLVSDNDVSDLEKYDIIQVVDCDDFVPLLERLPQSVFLGSVEDVYLERYLEELSGWRDNFAVLNSVDVSVEVRNLLDELLSMFALLENKEGKIISESEAERILEEVNDVVNDKIKEMTISGEGLVKMLSEGKMPVGILEIVRGAIEASGLSEHVFNLQIPVTIDYKELEDQIKRQSASEFTDMAERVKRNAEDLKRIPDILEKLSAMILVEDFCSGVLKYIGSGKSYPVFSENFHMSGAKNLFLRDAQAIDFQLDNFSRCSILTGANSGGKTTLLEHVLQNISLFNLGLPVFGEVHLPMFSDVYYFAKTKGSASKGAFETLLTQMSGIKNEGKVLILADEIEAVTEPGVAGRIISATAEFFIERNCFMILATHLGAEISKNLPERARIDGIEAKGLDENFNLVVDHNPVMGRLAHSTPELIVERMANAHKGDYFEFLFNKIKLD